VTLPWQKKKEKGTGKEKRGDRKEKGKRYRKGTEEGD